MPWLLTCALLLLCPLISSETPITDEAPSEETCARVVQMLSLPADGGNLPLVPRTCGGCNFGAMPGWWSPDEDAPGERWRMIMPGCKTRNLLPKPRGSASCARSLNGGDAASAAGSAAAATRRRSQTVLILGDSVDRELLQAVSDHVKDQPSAKCGGVRVVPPSCEGDPIFATIHLFGSSLSPPWHLNITVPYTTLLPDIIAHDWRGSLRLPDPDLVVMNSNMWDIARAFYVPSEDWWGEPVLPQKFIDSWITNTTEMVRFVQRMFPDAVIGWHTDVPGSYKPDGTTYQTIIGRHAYVVQLNAAGRALAAALGLPLIDYEAMVRGFTNFSYLKDHHHPNADVQLEVANIYLNLLQQLPGVPSTSRYCATSQHSRLLG